MAINSKAKGKRGELAWCRFCGGFGYTVRRTAQFCGNNESELVLQDLATAKCLEEIRKVKEK